MRFEKRSGLPFEPDECPECGTESMVLEPGDRLRCTRCHPRVHFHRVYYRRINPNGGRLERCRCGATRTQPHGGEFSPWERTESED